MKLYFYFLVCKGENKGIRMEECEVAEKPKTYKPVKEFPAGYYEQHVKKDDIGRLSGYRYDTVILTEPKGERAAELFSLRCKRDIINAEDKIRRAKEEIVRANALLKAIEKWKGRNGNEHKEGNGSNDNKQ